MNQSAGAASKPSETSSSAAPPGPSDAELVERVRAGDKAAFRTIFDRYHRRAYSVALGIVKQPQDALDVVQEAFVKVHKYLGGFEGNSSFYTWLYRIVMNVAIDHNRRKGRGTNVEYDDRQALDSADDVGTILPRLVDGNPSDVVSRKQLAARLEEALATLPEHHRAVIVLREVDGMSYEEMAEVLGVPKGTIMSRLFHARHKMQVALRGFVDDAGYDVGSDGEEETP